MSASAVELFGHQISTLAILLWLMGIFVVLAIIAGFIGRWMVRRGLRKPFIVRLINRASTSVVDVIKRPITVAVLNEVVDVLERGDYTRNAISAIQENHHELSAMFADKLKQDRTTRAVRLVPFHDAIISEVTETVLRVVVAILADPRTEELVADLIRDNVTQIRSAVQANEEADEHPPVAS
jgi:hypothetical protein